MRISEISTDSRRNSQEPVTQLLKELDSCIKEVENLPLDDLLNVNISGKFQKTLVCLNSLLPFPESAKLQIWKFSYRLWNTCVDFSNVIETRSGNGRNANCQQIDEEQAKLRQISADLLFLIGNVAGIPSPEFKNAVFYYRTGLIWHDLKKYEQASSCFERATNLIAKIDVDTITNDEERRLILDLNLARSRTAWEGSERNVALTLLTRSKKFLFQSSEHYKAVAAQYLQFGKVLSGGEKIGIRDALKLIDEALDVTEKGLHYAKKPDEAVALKNLWEKTLRFLAATHLQGEEFENVLKCIRVLREAAKTDMEHPSVAFMAMKAWLGLGRHAEAEKELKIMVADRKVPETVCIAAIEAFFQGAGAKGAEVAKTSFLGLLGRCHVNASAAVRVTQIVASAEATGGEEARLKAKVMAELASDERVVALFQGCGGPAVKETLAMHALLWNCGAEYFRWKDYNASAEMFEKSMLYVPDDADNRVLRAKSFRVLCLCHIGQAQTERAEEFINEAEKLDPNISCAFLKFKVFLQKQDEQRAINQIETMVNCIDFRPDFLTLSAHEAMAGRALNVAIACLNNLLSICSNREQLPITEVAITRQIIAFLLQIPDSDVDILKFTKRAQQRMHEIGAELFFGKGTVGKREVKWFAGHSWNMGIKMGREGKYACCSEFWWLASEFYSVMIEGTDADPVAACKSLILSVGSMIASEKQTNTALADSDMKNAHRMVDNAEKILSTISPECFNGNESSIAIQPSFAYLHTFNSFYLKSCVNGESQQHLIKSFATSKACTPQYLLQLGQLATHGPRPDPAAAEVAYKACLTAMLIDPSPDYQLVSFVIRKLIMLARVQHGEGDNQAYEIYREAYRLMVGLKQGEYPPDEGKWLATTAWNRSVRLAKTGQIENAKKWMQVGLDLAEHVAGLESYIGCMQKSLASIDNRQGNEPL